MSENDEPKIIVDEDWKSQVEKEKDQLRKESETGSPNDASEANPESMPIPEASFGMLMATIATQAISAMGLMPDPSTGQPNVNLPMAKHFVDTIAVLEEKTKGNLTDEEEALVTENLHQLRMAYVAASQQASNVEPTESSNIEIP
jgi:hypothetical protein